MNLTTPVELRNAAPVIKKRTDESIAVIGLGYVGLPVAVGFARCFADVVGFDINIRRITELSDGYDATMELSKDNILGSGLRMSANINRLKAASFYVVTVPTPIDQGNRPDLSPLRAACRSIASYLAKGDVIVFESTVYPGVTEDICGPLLAELSGLECGVDFTLGYSPERINPGDTEHRLETIIKIVSGQDSATLDRVADVYGTLVPAGVHAAPSIKVAEAAKVIENTQRDVNIALMNELAMICDRMDIRSADVLAAAGTKWNFLPFTPGLVGGHCIGVDPYYLTAKAEELGYHSEVILSGRRVNDGMGEFIATKAVKMLASMHVPLTTARVGVLGLTFKENVPDLRNSKTFDIINALADFGVLPMVHDPMASRDEVGEGDNYVWTELADMPKLDLLILAVPHHAYMRDTQTFLKDMLIEGGSIVDVRAALDEEKLPETAGYWSL